MSGSTNLNINSNIKSVVKKNNQSLKGYELYLLNGNDVLKDNIEKNKKRKKNKLSNFNNLLDELEYTE